MTQLEAGKAPGLSRTCLKEASKAKHPPSCEQPGTPQPAVLNKNQHLSEEDNRIQSFDKASLTTSNFQ